MYAPASSRHLGETVLVDPLTQDPMEYFTNNDGIVMTPGVVSTPGGGGGDGTLPAPSFAPAPVDSTAVPYTLPPLVATAPAPAAAGAPASSGPNLGTILLWGAVAFFATKTLLPSKGRR